MYLTLATVVAIQGADWIQLISVGGALSFYFLWVFSVWNIVAGKQRYSKSFLGRRMIAGSLLFGTPYVVRDLADFAVGEISEPYLSILWFVPGFVLMPLLIWFGFLVFMLQGWKLKDGWPKGPQKP